MRSVTLASVGWSDMEHLLWQGAPGGRAAGWRGPEGPAGVRLPKRGGKGHDSANGCLPCTSALFLLQGSMPRRAAAIVPKSGLNRRIKG